MTFSFFSDFDWEFSNGSLYSNNVMISGFLSYAIKDSVRYSGLNNSLNCNYVQLIFKKNIKCVFNDN